MITMLRTLALLFLMVVCVTSDTRDSHQSYSQVASRQKRNTPTLDCESGPLTISSVPTIIQSQGYPIPYLDDTDCSFDIIVGSGKVVVIKFLGEYDIDDSIWSVGGEELCCDYISLDDGEILKTTDIIDKTLTSCVYYNQADAEYYMQFVFFSNSVTAKFVTDSSNNVVHTGFKAEVTERDAVLLLYGNNELKGELANDGAFAVSFTFTMYGTQFDKVYINEDGVITLGEQQLNDASGFATSHLDPLSNIGKDVISMFLADHAFSLVGDPVVRYGVVTAPQELSVIDTIINDAFPCLDNPYVGTAALVVTYIRATFHGADINGKRLTNSYEVIITSNSGLDTYAILNYHEIRWHSGDDQPKGNAGLPARVGFAASDGRAYELPCSGQLPCSGHPDVITIDDDSNLNPKVPGRYVFKIDGNAIEEPQHLSVPTIECPMDITAVDCGEGADVSWNDPAVVSDCISYTGPTCDRSPGVFPASATVTCTASNDMGEAAPCSFQVTLQEDMTPPQIGPCDDITVADQDLGPGDTLIYDDPPYVDDCTTSVNCNPPSGSPFDIGSTEVTCTATDLVGLTDTCTFMVIVDVDECAGNNDNCEQTCTNTPGSFVCGCNPGFTLDSDGSTCHPHIRLCKMFHVMDGDLTFDQAKTACAGNNKELAAVRKATTNTQLVNIIQTNVFVSTSFWFGASKAPTGDWLYLDNSVVCYENWLSISELNEAGMDCGQFWSSSYNKWTSEDCTDKKGYICEEYKKL